MKRNAPSLVCPNLRHAVKAKHGLEKESMRIFSDGRIATTPHPKELGSSLTNHYIKTDFSEPQLEFATNARPRIEAIVRELQDLHIFTSRHLQNEWIWPFSMPPILPKEEKDIPLGQYGASFSGEWKTIYRNGLGHRYGRRMQTISGVHYNFSFSNLFLRQIFEKEISKFSKEEISEMYLSVIRNFFRKVHFVLYLTGATPAFDETFLPVPVDFPFSKHKLRTYFAPYATSLRMSEIGYTSKVQDGLPINYNSLQEYIDGMCYSVNTPYSGYESFGGPPNQLNPNYLQIENEFYSPIRPKQIPKNQERPLEALQNRGIQYIEIRCLDLEPESPTGVSKPSLAYIQMILLDGILRPSQAILDSEKERIRENTKRVIWEGRKPGLKILGESNSEIDFVQEGKDFTNSLFPIAEELDRHSGRTFYRETLYAMLAKWDDPGKTPSGRFLNRLLEENWEFSDLGIHLAKENYRNQSQMELTPGKWNSFEKEVHRSVWERDKIEETEKVRKHPTPKICNH
ncbi:glutamate--cysteine ligase [Leptospira inadai serovar Lyme str. 10]|uniref:Glutamate--cysteine ligase n=2 Tax=Leptospira inadai serovar Lyme TaxID=293084 RepID=V6HC56_9LEPT|nr:glutamate--cysteine ligase [Leptospira inadai]EQA37172.1 glutamate--cysteine ligase [Leptospira inadai serovar Lyme str. 10]PNV76577.1 glutamate--cysteine ligase [Leptospira inadai serovar Lyme]